MIGKLIREDRERRSVNQVDLAKSAGLSQAYISQVENGERTPTPDVIDRIAKTLDVGSARYVQEMLESKDMVEKAIRGLSPNDIEKIIRYIERLKKRSTQ